MLGQFDNLAFSVGSVKTIIAGTCFALLFTAERIAASAQRPDDRARLFRNGGLWLIVVIASPLVVAPMTAFGANHLLWTRPESFSALGLFFDLIVLDLWTYGVHRAHHRIPLFWRFHKVHHYDEFLDTSSAFRFHLGEVAISAALRLIPIVLLAVPLMHVILFETLLVCAAIFHHSNLRLPPRFEAFISVVIVTPSIHWVHHHAVTADTNSNYAAIFSLWDRLFRSRSVTIRQPDMKIGVEHIEDKPLMRLILSPLMRSE
ncbi:sterol desaturase family protein [Hyphococcus sp.]|uniref:sterol desaturase family protein n=1 Tax=Hyphococcus sp. TaxID=2038636 RepID=UPI0037534FE8